MARKNQRYYRTIDLARAAHVHPNTVRLGSNSAVHRCNRVRHDLRHLHALAPANVLAGPTRKDILKGWCASVGLNQTVHSTAYITKLMHAPLLVI